MIYVSMYQSIPIQNFLCQCFAAYTLIKESTSSTHYSLIVGLKMRILPKEKTLIDLFNNIQR